jgi:hypothetical protein
MQMHNGLFERASVLECGRPLPLSVAPMQEETGSMGKLWGNVTEGELAAW